MNFVKKSLKYSHLLQMFSEFFTDFFILTNYAFFNAVLQVAKLSVLVAKLVIHFLKYQPSFPSIRKCLVF